MEMEGDDMHTRKTISLISAASGIFSVEKARPPYRILPCQSKGPRIRPRLQLKVSSRLLEMLGE